MIPGMLLKVWVSSTAPPNGCCFTRSPRGGCSTCTNLSSSTSGGFDLFFQVRTILLLWIVSYWTVSYFCNIHIVRRTFAHTPVPTGYTTMAYPHQSPGMVLMSIAQRPTMLCGNVECMDVPTAVPNLVTSCHLLRVCPQLIQN